MERNQAERLTFFCNFTQLNLGACQRALHPINL